MSTSQPTVEPSERPAQRRRRWPWITVGSVIFLLVGAHLAGGLYFAGLIRSDGFAPSGPQSFIDATAGLRTNGTITLIVVDDSEDPFREGVYGLKWDGGYGQIGAIVTDIGTEVVREFTMIDGAEPDPGTSLDVMGWAWPSDPRTAFGYDFENIAFETELGSMDAWVVPGTTDQWAIFVHGKGVDRREGLRSLPVLHEAGLPVMAITYRNDIGQPEDPSGLYRYGQTEWRDLEAAVEYALDRGADRFVLVGDSTGAAVVSAFLLESGLAPLVDGVVFDSPNIDFEQSVDVEASRRRLPGIGLPIPPTLTWTAKRLASIQMGFSWGDFDYIDDAEALSAPMLVFHGTEDRSVPIELSRSLAAARPDLVTLVETDAGHVMSWNVDPGSYERHIADFVAGLQG